LTKDNCPNGDFSDSYYDRKCGTPPEDDEKTFKEEKSEQTHGSAEYSQEDLAIYEWARKL
jgi:hypothetical protein